MMRLVVLRKTLGETQAGFARRVGLNNSTMNAIENRRLRPWPGQLRKIADGLGWPHEHAAALLEEVNIDA